MEFKKYINLGIILGGILIVDSCATVPEKYNIPQFIRISHEEVMTTDFPDKKSVFLKFGTPTTKETLENVENWYYKIAEITNTTSIGHSSGIGLIKQNPNNVGQLPINRSLITSQVNTSAINSKSTTVETYMKFWFENDSVIKWETYGVDYGKLIPNKMYDEKVAKENQLNREKAFSKNRPVVMGLIFAFVFTIVIMTI